MLNTCSVLRELGAALNMETSCRRRRRRRKASFLKDEAMMARLVWKVGRALFPYPVLRNLTAKLTSGATANPYPQQRLYTENENKHTCC